MRRHARTGLFLVPLALLVAACSGGDAAAVGGERTIHVAAIEPKGGTSVADEPFPAEALPDGGGYKLVEPNDEGRWEVSTYRWLPNDIIVFEGERVTLEILGVNGAAHPSVIEGYDVAFDVKRGEVATVSFVADKVGTFAIRCDAHAPTMTGNLIVLPRDT